MPTLLARKGVALSIRKGQHIRVTNTHGKQVVDFWAFNPSDSHDYLSTVHSRRMLSNVSLRKGQSLYSTRRKPIVTLVEDTTPGIHDIILPACDAERYRMLGATDYHDNCHDNMHGALREHCPDFKVADDWVPDPFNMFLNVAIDHDGSLHLRPPTSEKGQYVVLRAEADLIIVMSSCPQDMTPINAGQPADLEYAVFDDASCSREASSSISRSLTRPTSPKRVKVAISFDFDAVSGWLGTGCHPDNNMADYSSGIFAGQVGAIRLLNLLKKTNIADKVTWFIPGHTIETFPASVQKVVESGAEIGLHGYSHEGIYQMTSQQESDVLDKCIEVATKLCGGKKPRGYRAPLYTIRETTVELLRRHQFLYDSSLSHHDSEPFWTPADPPIEKIDFSKDASSWMHPTPIRDPKDLNPFASNPDIHPLVEIPCNWYSEDMTPLHYFPHVNNSMGYVSTRVVEQMWKDKFMWLWENAPGNNEEAHDEFDSERANDSADFVFPLLMHPDTSGMAHIIGMCERMIDWFKGFGDSVQFHKHEDIAKEWLAAQKAKQSKDP